MLMILVLIRIFLVHFVSKLIDPYNSYEVSAILRSGRKNTKSKKSKNKKGNDETITNATGNADTTTSAV